MKCTRESGWAPAALALVMLASCGEEPAPAAVTEVREVPEVRAVPEAPPVTVGPATEADTAAFAVSTRSVTIDLLRHLRAEPGNVAFSPASISAAMAMTLAGARGETAAQMARALHFGAEPEALHRAASAQLAAWNDPARSTYALRVANRVFVDGAVQLEPAFVAITRDVYGSPVEGVSFRAGAAAARGRINAWAAEQTDDHVAELLPSGAVDSATALVLANAVYFHGTWRYQFPVDATRDAPFHVEPGVERTVSMMHVSERFGYAPADEAQILEMPYVGEELALVIVLPRERAGLAALEERLTLEVLDEWIAALRPRTVDVSLPRFRVDPPASLALRPALSAMGMPLAFGRSADLSGIARTSAGMPPLSISEVFHKAFMEVNEEGTEAAAATAVVIVRRSVGGGPAGPPQLRVDHPFLFFLRDRSTGAILFAGRVVVPEPSRPAVERRRMRSAPPL